MSGDSSDDVVAVALGPNEKEVIAILKDAVALEKGNEFAKNAKKTVLKTAVKLHNLEEMVHFVGCFFVICGAVGSVRNFILLRFTTGYPPPPFQQKEDVVNE